MDRPQPMTGDARLMEPGEASRHSFGDAFERLVGIMARLRGPDGCPWDRAQDLDSIKPYLVEETYEVVDALESGNLDDHQEELGDLLLQVVFQAELRREAGKFDAADVAHGICDKLVRRHPHVFAAEDAGSESEALDHWERQKAKEKADRSAIDGVPRRLPGLLRAQRTTEKASRVGFDWNDASGPLAKLTEELGELKAAIEANDKQNMQDELGDVLFTVVNLARFLGVSAEDAVNGTTNRFASRFKRVEAEVRGRGDQMHEQSIEVLEALWQAAKAAEAEEG